MENRIKTLEHANCSELCHKMEVPSDEEVEALNVMRTIKERVREIKKLLSKLDINDSADERKSELREELDLLKDDWQKWEKKRAEAARTRMILLGHEEP